MTRTAYENIWRGLDYSGRKLAGNRRRCKIPPRGAWSKPFDSALSCFPIPPVPPSPMAFGLLCPTDPNE